jgi:sugar transferase (PEP-CTERM system associated)
LSQILRLYFPSRTVFLLAGELAAILFAFSVAILIRFQGGVLVVFIASIWRILFVASVTLLSAYYMELYDLQGIVGSHEIYPRVLKLIGIVSLLLAMFSFVHPNFLVDRNVSVIALIILTPAWIFWRAAYERLIFHPSFRQRVYLIGDGRLALRVKDTLQSRRELGMDLVGWTRDTTPGSAAHQSIKGILLDLATKHAIERVVVAVSDCRSVLPVSELLELRLRGVVIEEGTTLLEQVSGQIEVDELRPSWLIYCDGFRLRPKHWIARRVVSTAAALALTIGTIAFVPLIAILILLTSPGPILYRQKRVGLQGRIFECYKFRTMRSDAEADTGPTWAADDDPRITRVGKFLRTTRLDEIPQLWNVLKGDMAFVGPRPERPEFVEQLSKVIPYYKLRHATRPGITGWAQISYKYGNTVEDAKQKLRYDLYYIKNCSPAFDGWIVFNTIRTVLLGKGAK